VKKSIIIPLSFLFIGLLSLQSCGNETKVKPTSKKLPSPAQSSKKEVVNENNNDSLLLAEAYESKEVEEEEINLKEKENFSPPHIPVFKEEKKKSKAKDSKKSTKTKTDKLKVSDSKKVSSADQKANSKIESKVKTKPEAVIKKKVIKEVSESKGKNTEIVWRRNFYSFGDITQGDTVYFKFEFTNIGDAPLVIESATPSCDCTFPSYSFIPIQPNEKGEIKGIYVSDTKKGSQNAMIQVVTNTKPTTHKLYIDGNVLLPEGNSQDGEKGQ